LNSGRPNRGVDLCGGSNPMFATEKHEQMQNKLFSRLSKLTRCLDKAVRQFRARLDDHLGLLVFAWSEFAAAPAQWPKAGQMLVAMESKPMQHAVDLAGIEEN